jgi:hypothetical protein
MHVEVSVEELVPRMEDHDATQLAAEVVPTELEQGLTGSRKQEAQEQPSIAQDQWVEGMGQRKHGVKVWDGQEFRLTVCDPLRCGEALTFRTVPIATRVVSVALEAALRALLHMSTKLGRTTGRDGF